MVLASELCEHFLQCTSNKRKHALVGKHQRKQSPHSPQCTYSYQVKITDFAVSIVIV